MDDKKEDKYNLVVEVVDIQRLLVENGNEIQLNGRKNIELKLF